MFPESLNRPCRSICRTMCAVAACCLCASASAQIFLPVPDLRDPLERMQDSIERIVDRVSPGVVSIEAQFGPTAQGGPSAALGTGFVVRADGMILTSDHVINGALSIQVTSVSGARMRARQVASDPRSDLAVIQIEDRGIAALDLGGSRRARRGQMVLAFGYPMQPSRDGGCSTGFGLIGAISRPLPESLGYDEDRYYGEMIEVTTPIGPGFSGGPLVDIHGRVIGVLTAATNRVNAADNLAFAVPVTARTKQIIERLLAGDRIEYGYLGIQVRDADSHLNPSVNWADASPSSSAGHVKLGAVLQGILPGGPAERAGLAAGDLIVAVDGRTVESADDLVRFVGDKGPEVEVRVDFVRSGRQASCQVRLSRRLPASDAKHEAPPRQEWVFRGASLTRLDPRIRTDNSLPSHALIVTTVVAGSAAERAGLTPGDIIVRIDGKAVSEQVADALSAISDDCLVGLANGGSVLIRKGK